jgi:hypothetical protein
MTMYLSAAVAGGMLTVEQAHAVLEVKRTGRKDPLGLIAKELGFLREDEYKAAEVHFAKLNQLGIKVPDCLARFYAVSERTSFETRLPDYLLQEYWQLRQEIRDRLNSIRAVLGVAVTAFTAVIAATATLLSRAGDPGFLPLAILWLAPHAVLLPSMRIIFSDRLTLMSLARYIRLHVELPFFEAAFRMTPCDNKQPPFLRMPLGWESHLLLLRWVAHDMLDKDSNLRLYLEAKKGKNRKREKLPWSNEKDAQTILGGAGLAMQPSVFTDPKNGDNNCEAILSCYRRDRMESTSITWIMRSLSAVSTGTCVAFILLALSAGQITGLDPQGKLTGLAGKVGSNLLAYILVGCVAVLSATLLIMLVQSTKKFTDVLRVKNFWDVPSLDSNYTEHLIKQFRDAGSRGDAEQPVGKTS